LFLRDIFRKDVLWHFKMQKEEGERRGAQKICILDKGKTEFQ